jgi:acid stress chaperone HdeB
MKTVFLVAAGILLCLLPANAQQGSLPSLTIDVTTLTCKELMAGNDDDREAGISYVHGYMAGKSGIAVINLGAIGAHTDRFRDVCLSNPTLSVIDAYTKSAK